MLDSASPVNGLVLCPSANRFSLSVRLYVCPSTVMTDTLKRKKRLPLLMLTQLVTCFLVVLALVLLLSGDKLNLTIINIVSVSSVLGARSTSAYRSGARYKE